MISEKKYRYSKMMTPNPLRAKPTTLATRFPVLKPHQEQPQDQVQPPQNPQPKKLKVIVQGTNVQPKIELEKEDPEEEEIQAEIQEEVIVQVTSVLQAEPKIELKKEEPEEEEIQDEREAVTDTTKNSNPPSTCSHTFKKNGPYHKKGDPCTNPVAKNPRVGGEKNCSKHQPEDAPVREVCENILYKGRKQRNCRHNVAKDGSVDGERFCHPCIHLRKTESNKLNHRPGRTKKQCQELLEKGRRKGKPCGNVIPKKSTASACPSCLKKKKYGGSETTNRERENNNFDQSEVDDLIEDLFPYAAQSNLNIKSLLSTRSIENDSPLDQVLPEHIKFVIQALTCTVEVPEDMIHVLYWAAHDRFCCNSQKAKTFWERINVNNDDEDDTDDSPDKKDKDEWVQRKSVESIQQIKYQLIQKIKELLQEVSQILPKSERQIKKLDRQLTKSATRELKQELCQQFLSFLFKQGKTRRKGQGAVIKSDPKTVAIDQFVNSFIADRVRPTTIGGGDGMTTSQILDEYNDWRTSHQDAPDIGVVSFGLCLKRINHNKQQWSVVGDSNKRHVVQFVKP